MRPTSLLVGSSILLLTSPVAAQERLGAIRLTLDFRTTADIANLGNIGSAIVAKDGSLAVIDHDLRAVRFFSATGAPVGVFGRGGEGPGEFHSLNSAGWLGDTLWVSDYNTRRLTFISPARRLLRIEPYPTLNAKRTTTASSLTISAVYPDRSYAAEVHFAKGSALPDWANGYSVSHTPTVRLTAAGSVASTISWESSGAACEARYAFGGGFGVVSIPYCESSLTGHSSDGGVFTSVTLGPVMKGIRRYHVTTTGSSGATLYTRGYEFTPEPIPTRVADSVMARKRARLRGDAAALRALSTVRVPYAYPPLQSILVGTDSTVWLEKRTTDAKRHWLALSPRGELAGTLTLPSSSTLIAATRRSIWVTEEDEDGMLGLTRYDLTWPR